MRLKSASELDYPPLAIVKTDGMADGFSVELLRAVTQAVGLEIEFKVGPWHAIKEQLKAGEIDVLPLVSYTVERDEWFDFTVPYLRMRGTIFVREGNHTIRTEKDLKNKSVLVMQGDTAQEYVVQHQLTDRLVLTETFEQAFTMLSAGQGDAVVVQQLVGFQLIKKLGIQNVVCVENEHQSSLKPFEKPLSGFEQKFCFAVHEGNKDLQASLNEGLAIINSNGTYDALYQKWLGPILPQQTISFIETLKRISMILIPLLVALGFIGIWFLKREVKRKTESLRKEIQDRKQVEEALRKSENKYRLLVENQTDLVIKLDAEHRFLFASPTFCKAFGRDEAAFLGQTFSAFVYSEDQDAALKKTEALLNPPYTITLECRFQTVTGLRWFAWSKTSVLDGYGLVTEIIGVGRDITDRNLLEQKSRQLSRIFDESINEIFLFHSKSLKFIQVNKAGLDNLSYTMEELHDMTLAEITPEITMESFEELMAPLRKREEESVYFETTLKRKNQTVYDGEVHVQLMENGDETLFFAIVLDISEKKRMQRHLLQSQKMEAIGTLAGGIAHDFNNILASILGYTEMILEDLPETGIHREDLRVVLASAYRAKELVAQILSFSRQSEEIMVPVKVQSILKETLKLIRASFPSNIEVRQRIDAKCRPVLANPANIHQVLMNLITNARHAIGETNGVLEISLSETEIGPLESVKTHLIPGDYICCTVSDTGLGMDQFVMDRIFEPYFTTKSKDKGTGLGLAVCHGIIARLSGLIAVTSEPGKGSEFKVLIPVDKSAQHVVSEQIVQFFPRGSEHLLIVDDEPGILDLMKKTCEKLGYAVTTCQNGLEAWQLFQASPDRFDLVITDTTMPIMTGDQLAKNILDLKPQFPIILVSGFSGKIDKAQAEEMGIKAFLDKPLDRQKLAVLLRQLLVKE